jgi:hypothetical protein
VILPLQEGILFLIGNAFYDRRDRTGPEVAVAVPFEQETITAEPPMKATRTTSRFRITAPANPKKRKRPRSRTANN